MADVNKHGLKRQDLNEEVRRLVRQRCGFACVICHSLLYHYDHFDPPFEEALEHRPEGITLLCGGCHDKVSRGVWSRDKIRRRDLEVRQEKREPHLGLDLRGPVQVVIGATLFHGQGPLIVVDDRPMLSVREIDGRAILDAEFRDQSGDVVLKIVANEMTLVTGQWDATFIGKKLTIRSAPNKIVFEAILQPPNGLYVRQMEITVNGIGFKTNPQGFNMDRAQNPFFVGDDQIMSTVGGLRFEGQHLRIRPGFAIIPFPNKRFTALAQGGDFSTLLDVVHGPVIHVESTSDQRTPEGNQRWAVRPDHTMQIPALEELHKTELLKAEAIALAKSLLKFASNGRVIVHHGNGRLGFLFP